MTGTLDADQSSSAAGNTPAAKPSLAQRIVGVFFSPDATFRDIAARPDIVLPLVIFVLVGIVGAVVVSQHVDFGATMRAELESRGGMSQEQIARTVKMGSAVARAMIYFSPFLSIALLALVAGVYLIAFRLFGGEGGFKQAFSITLWAWMPLSLKSLLMSGILFTRKTIPAEDLVTLVRSNLAFLVDPLKQRVLFGLLASLDVFMIWMLVLLTLGFAYMAKMSKGRSAALVFGIWASFLVVKTGFAAMFAGLRGK